MKRPVKIAQCFCLHSNPVFAAFAAAAVAACVFPMGCKASPPKGTVAHDWSEFAALNPTDIIVMRVEAPGVPPNIRFDSMREAIRDQLLDHRYSPLAFEYTDSGKPAAPSTTPGVADAAGGAGAPPVVRVRLVVKEYTYRSYEIARRVRLGGEFQFLDGATQRLLASVSSDQWIDLSDEARRGANLDDALRTANRRFVEVSLQGMPDRRVETEAPKSAR